MKRMILTTILMAAGTTALAQQVPAAGATAPAAVPAVVPAAAPAAAPAVVAVPPVAVATTTNAAEGKPDVAKMQALFTELSNINKELRPQEEKIQAGDADVKALADKRDAAMQSARDIEMQRRDLLDKKLAADPVFAPLVAKRRELQQTLKEMRPQSAPGMREGRPGRVGPRQMPPSMESPDASARPVPKLAAPEPVKPAANPAPQPVK